MYELGFFFEFGNNFIEILRQLRSEEVGFQKNIQVLLGEGLRIKGRWMIIILCFFFVRVFLECQILVFVSFLERDFRQLGFLYEDVGNGEDWK